MEVNMKKQIGFTLIEMLLVLVIASMIIIMGIGYMQQRTQAMRNDRVSAQMQQILNAGLSYYVANGKWPVKISDLQSSPAYLPATFKSPWGKGYFIANTPALFYAYTQIESASTSGSAFANASVIAGTLPLGYTSRETPIAGSPPSASSLCSPGNRDCTVAASVNIPGQNLNNATAVNYAGLYHSGACVPAPECPVDKDGKTMIPQIFVVPVQINGVNDNPSGTPNVYPISSFAAFAQTQFGGNPGPKPQACPGSSSGNTCNISGGTPSPSDRYWRVCIAATTEKGSVSPTNPNWGKYEGIVMAITRCAVNNEPTGSGFDVWQ
jgi:prepilin-type N-terminal cleavage/methylation domain-containing protein